MLAVQPQPVTALTHIPLHVQDRRPPKDAQLSEVRGVPPLPPAQQLICLPIAGHTARRVRAVCKVCIVCVHCHTPR